MSDIVERLRGAGPGGWNEEAADEIGRLREALILAKHDMINAIRLIDNELNYVACALPTAVRESAKED